MQSSPCSRLKNLRLRNLQARISSVNEKIAFAEHRYMDSYCFRSLKKRSRGKAWIVGSQVNYLNFKKEVSKVLERDQEIVSL